jgi:DNA-binding beta-propeller fold protein YncE
VGKGQQAAIVDGQPGPRFDAILSAPRFCNEGRRVAYVASNAGARFLVVDGERVGAALLAGADFVTDLAFTPDGQHVVHVTTAGSFWAAFARNMATGAGSSEKAVGRTGKRRVYVDRQPGQEYDTRNITGLQFTADGHVIYVVHGLKEGSRNVSLVVIDRTEAKRYDTVWTRTLSVQDSGSVAYVAQSGRKFVRVTQTIQ